MPCIGIPVFKTEKKKRKAFAPTPFIAIPPPYLQNDKSRMAHLIIPILVWVPADFQRI